MEKETHKEVLLSKVHPDENQPRKDFNAARLAELISSIKEHGIMNPLVVEAHPSGEYLLVDGERRYRAAQELKLKKVPVITVKPMNTVDRLVKQFHIQEQHEGWTSTEKAVAIGQLAEDMKMTPVGVAKLLSLPERTIRDYMGFWNLMTRKDFERSEVPITMARNIVGARDKAKKVYEAEFEKELTQEKQKGIERQIIAQIKAGEIKRQSDITKLVDTFSTDPKMIDTFIKGKGTVTKLYLESNAKVAHHARNVRQIGSLLSTHINYTVELGGVPLLAEDEVAVRALKKLSSELNSLVSTM